MQCMQLPVSCLDISLMLLFMATKILDQFSVYAIPQITGSSQLLQDVVIFCLSTSINCMYAQIRSETYFLFCISLSSRSLVVCCFSMRIANDRSIRGPLHDVEQHYECSNRRYGCAFAQATSALDAETDLTIQKASDMRLQ